MRSPIHIRQRQARPRASDGERADAGAPSAEDAFRSVLESAPDAIVICDEAGVIVLVNRRAEKLFGYGREQMVAAPLELLIPRREDEQAHPDGWFAQLRSHAAAGRYP